jgi:catechol 2,3-dioxygenase-like lactoylglutathione lyase family enzyme
MTCASLASRETDGTTTTRQLGGNMKAVSLRGFLCSTLSLAWLACAGAAEPSAPTSSEHTIGLAKLIVGDLNKTQAFYDTMFGMKEVGHYSADGVYDEPIMGFATGDARLALFKPLAEAPVQKPQAPQVLIYTPDFETLVAKLEAAKHPLRRLSPLESGPFKIAIVRDPSGNAVEIFAREGRPMEIGGSKLIVDSREKAEQFFTQVFGVKPIQRFRTSTYDEVLLGFGDGPWLALFEPKDEPPLPKSRYPLVAIYTSEFDAVLARVKEAGYGYREVASTGRRIIVAKDPAGNGVEIIERR